MKHEPVERFTVSVPADLMRQLDAMVRRKGYTNRSLAVADMVRAHLVEHQSDQGDQVLAGTITLVYDHHQGHVLAQLTTLQHDHGSDIVSSLHVHLDHHNCLEVLVVKGRARDVRSLADKLIAVKGVKHGRLTLTTTGKNLSC